VFEPYLTQSQGEFGGCHADCAVTEFYNFTWGWMYRRPSGANVKSPAQNPPTLNLSVYTPVPLKGTFTFGVTGSVLVS
jgi:hypothetical protein